jgi:hypothetical protein
MRINTNSMTDGMIVLIMSIEPRGMRVSVTTSWEIKDTQN